LKKLPGFPGQDFLNVVISEHVEVRMLSLQIEDICNRLVKSISGTKSANSATSMDLDGNGQEDELIEIDKLRRDLDNTLTQVRKMDALIDKMSSSAQRIRNAQQSIFVPYIAAFVTKDEQEKFNRRVIARLGLLDSQVHLVSMTEAIKDLPEELHLFKVQIPRVAQALIPVWKKRLYSPKASCLEITDVELMHESSNQLSSSTDVVPRDLIFTS